MKRLYANLNDEGEATGVGGGVVNASTPTVTPLGQVITFVSIISHFLEP